ncbi:centriole and centriolar satellite protein OFD1 isoform X2 [Rhineura floridana]|uniref:centriole and centriolar satellite protein OFD1 isoform X2 n=1 Tax=Rhineura floridana TaxID=261503 RepID=UPI002AC85D57|nr:centriole and centriolar satellite protein OFD1 isoform X2 [Rhineura floridana]
MSSSEFKVLSQDEFRKRLYQTFKNRGVLDTLKTQLRNQLIHELMNPIVSGEIQPQAISSECSSLLIVASNSLVADHLHRCGYEYSLSVFYPESGLEKDKILTMQDLLQLIRINPKTDLYKALTSASKNDNSKGFLVQILTELIEHSLCKERCDTETQTSPAPCKESLAEKLQLIDEQFADMYPQRHKFESFQVKLAEYRKEIEQQLQAEMSQKLQHFKEVEIAKIKMDERAQSKNEISEIRRDFEKVYRAKSEALTSRERNAIERLQKQQEIDAREIYLQRQSLLKDIETIRSREAELKQRIESFELAQKLQESKNKTIEEALCRREVTVKNIEETYDQKLKNELLKYQLELKEEYIARTKKITEDEKKNKDKAMLLHEETICINSKKQEFEQAVLRAKELEREIDSVKAQILLLSKQNQLLTEKLEEVSDYPMLKEEKMEFQMQNKLLRQQMEEARNENLKLRDKLSRPSSEYLVLQAELKRAEHARKLECEESETHKLLLEKQLQNEVDHCVQLKSQLSECENTIRKLNAQMEDLKLQLKQTQTALENEVYRNPKPSLVDRSVIDLIGDRIVPHDVYIDGAFLKTQPVNNIIGLENATSPSRRHHHILKSSTSPDSDLEFVANTKARIKELEREAECLEEAYKNYQHRAIQSTVGSAKAAFSSPLPNNFTVASRQRLWFPQDDLYSQEFPFHCQKSKSYNWIPGNEDHLKDHLTPPQKRAASSRRLSSTPVSKAKRNITKRLFSEDTVDSSFAAPHQNADHPVSPILKTGNLSSPEPSSNISASSPALSIQKLSLHQEQGENLDVSDSAKPEELLYKDLGNDDSAGKYQEDIPEQFESDVSHPSHIVNESYVPATVLATGTSQHDISGAEITALERQKQPEEQEKEEEEQKWEEEKNNREIEGEAGRESKEALESKQGELEEMNEELCVQESVETEKKQKEVTNLETSVSKSDEHGSDAIPNPLEKYMKIIQQNREEELANKDFKKEEMEISSERHANSEKEDSFSAAATLHGEPDDDFW